MNVQVQAQDMVFTKQPYIEDVGPRKMWESLTVASISFSFIIFCLFSVLIFNLLIDMYVAVNFVDKAWTSARYLNRRSVESLRFKYIKASIMMQQEFLSKVAYWIHEWYSL